MTQIELNVLKYITNKILTLYDNENQAIAISWWILEFIANRSKLELIAQKKIVLSQEQQKQLDEFLFAHVEKKMPLQYIFGSVPFLNLNIIVEPPILIPRPETEDWCDTLISIYKTLPKSDFKILDMCTGTGCIALAFASGFKKSHVVAVDISLQASMLANKNTIINKIDNVTVIKSDLFNDVNLKCKNSSNQDVKFDLIVTNPPYISKQEWELLDPMVKDWEDITALFAEDEGLFLIKKFINQAKKYILKQDWINENIPQIAMEIGYKQGEIVKSIFEQEGYQDVKIHKDLFGNDRFITACV